jgi:AcrR family transcriptional regulator
MTSPRPNRQRGSRQLWLDAAYDILISDGIEAVKVMPLARHLNQSRTGFYWFFDDLAELHTALIERWESRSIDPLVARCDHPAETICEALFNLMDCWLDPSLFDARLDLAIRNWARNDADLQQRLDAADAHRIKAVVRMFGRFGFSPEQAEVRGLTMIYTQIGYISMHVTEDLNERLARMLHYAELFAGTRPSTKDIARFQARHLPEQAVSPHA